MEEDTIKDGEEKAVVALHPDLPRLRLYREGCLEFRRRRHNDWNQTYALYRDKVTFNRITQRQSVNIPLMKSSVLSLLKDIDDAPLMYFDNKDNDDQKELFYNEYWKEVSRINKLVIQDIIDKKQVMLFGRSFKKINISNGMVTFEIVDPQDMLVDKYVDPAILDSARVIIHQNIFKPLKEVERNRDYDQEEVKKITQMYDSDDGVMIGEQNTKDAIDRQAREETLGVENIQNPTLGETLVKLEEFYVREYDEDLEEDVIYVYVVADDTAVILKTRLENVLGKTEDNYWRYYYPFTTWGADPERSDFWCDGVGDVLRGPNEVVNLFYSQEVENRTLKNYNMNYYDATKSKEFIPQTFTPNPWGWYPVPGNPNEVTRSIPVADLSDARNTMEFVLNIAKEAVAASSTSQGAVEQKKVTLGEIQLALGNAKERVKSFQPLYQESWMDFGYKYTKILEGRSDMISEVKVTRKGRLGRKYWTRTIKPSNWETMNGYLPVVKMMTDKTQEDADGLNKLVGIKQFFPTNTPLETILKKKALEFGGLDANERKEVMDFEKQSMMALTNGTANANMNGTGPMVNNAPQPALPVPTATA